MQGKKKLIARLALGAAVVAVLGAAAAIAGFVLDARQARAFDTAQTRAKAERVDEARAYLAELAGRVKELPVDPALVSEIESRYFEEQAQGPLYVWAMDTRGEFAFGVPRAAFARLNTIYDREVTPRLKEGVFVDRQSFLLGLVDDVADIEPMLVEEEKAAALVDRRREWRLDRWEPEQSFVLSAPLKAEDGAALGSVYLKRLPMREASQYRTDPRVEALTAGGMAVLVLASLFLWVLLPSWIYVDARERGVRRAPLYAFLAVLSSLVGLLVYLLARPEHARLLSCPGCQREVNGGAYCPHCGRDLASAICPTCRYPLKPDWAFCPSCRTEVRAQTAGLPVTEAG
jgi:hypothetical protein